MKGIVATLTDKQQPLLRAIVFAGIAAPRAGLTGVVGVHFDRHTATESRLVRDVAMQFGKGPLRGMAICSPLLLARPLALATFDALANICQVLQADEPVAGRVPDPATDPIVP